MRTNYTMAISRALLVDNFGRNLFKTQSIWDAVCTTTIERNHIHNTESTISDFCTLLFTLALYAGFHNTIIKVSTHAKWSRCTSEFHVSSSAAVELSLSNMLEDRIRHPLLA